MDISVIIPCWNEERHVAPCLEALLAQTFPRDRYELIFVDNGSTDRSADVARHYAPVTVLQEPKQGSYAARNTGARVARGRILAFTDADCVVCPEWLERIHAELADNRTAVILGSRRFARETAVLSKLADYEMEKARFVFSQNDAALYYAYTNNMAVQRDVFDRVGPFVEVARGGDVVFVSAVIAACGCDAVRFVPEVRVRHLEIDRWYGWHRKMWLYGRSYQRNRALSGTRPLSYRERFAVWRTASRRGNSPLFLGTVLLLSGAAATLAYEAGRFVERLRVSR